MGAERPRIRLVRPLREPLHLHRQEQDWQLDEQQFGLVRDNTMKVRVRFSPEVAHTIKERVWRPGQQVTSDNSGRVTLEFEAAGEMELVAWILSYGMHAEVLEPAELRQEVKRQVREMRQFYRSKDRKPDKGAKRHA